MGSEHAASRHYNQWELEDYELLVQALRRQLEIDEIAEEVGRSPGAVRSRVKYLLPPGAAAELSSASKILLAVREELADPHYDWVLNV